MIAAVDLKVHGDSLHLGFVLICESVADDGGTQSALRASKARVTGGVLRVGRQLPSASRWVPCGAERELIGHFPLSVAEQRLCVPKHTALLWGGEDAAPTSGDTATWVFDEATGPASALAFSPLI